MALPTYADTIRGPDVLTFIIPYMDRRSLLDACLACRRWNQVFGEHLWSNPLKVIAETRTPFANTYLFFSRSEMYRFLVRRWVFSLDFRPLRLLEHRFPKDHAIYSQVTTPKYVFRYVSLFENLRFLVMDDMEGFDYEVQDDLERRPPSADTRLLLFSSTGIPFLNYNLFISTPILFDMMYLDLSYTSPSQTWSRLLSSHVFDNLRILKLRGLRMTDGELPINVLQTQLRLWSLDLRDNWLTDVTIDLLRRQAFEERRHGPLMPKSRSDEVLYEEPPVYHELAESNLTALLNNPVVPLRPDTTDTFIAYMKAYGNLRGPTSYSLSDADPMNKSTGLTHLYLSNNRFTSRSIMHLLQGTDRLQVLDVGTVRANPAFSRSFPHTTSFCQLDTWPHLFWDTGSRMEKLRIHHSIITLIPTIAQGYLERGYIPQHLRKAEKFGETDKEGFSPLHNYGLTSLTLTDIPLKSTGPTITRLITFLRKCAQQEQFLRSAASRPRNHRSPPLLPGLKKLRLEFIKEQAGTDEIGPSVSEDQDADEFMAQSIGDFSFFADEKMPETPVSRRGSVLSGWSARGSGPGSEKSSLAEVKDLKDVVEELKVFRQREQPRWGGILELVVPVGPSQGTVGGF